jgi:drug/metabolite transporter (DMT)-like permease
MASLLALASALLYGAADFTGGLATRRAGTLPVIVLSQFSGLVLLVALMPFLPPAAPSRADLLWGLAAGLTGGAGVALLYYALAIGRMAVVAPTTAVCAVTLPVAVAVARGERPAVIVGLGILLGLVAIVLVGQQTPTEPAATPTRRARGGLPPGVGVALVSGVAIGLFFLSLAHTRAEAGMWPVLTARALSTGLFGVAAAVARRSLRMPGVLGLTLVCGVVDMSANALYLLAARSGPLSVVVTLSSLYPASTVLLARLLLGERLNPRQVAGVGCALAAILLIVSGGGR